VQPRAGALPRRRRGAHNTPARCRCHGGEQPGPPAAWRKKRHPAGAGPPAVSSCGAGRRAHAPRARKHVVKYSVCTRRAATAGVRARPQPDAPAWVPHPRRPGPVARRRSRAADCGGSGAGGVALFMPRRRRARLLTAGRRTPRCQRRPAPGPGPPAVWLRRRPPPGRWGAAHAARDAEHATLARGAEHTPPAPRRSARRAELASRVRWESAPLSLTCRAPADAPSEGVEC
jgi:hypothetical protein